MSHDRQDPNANLGITRWALDDEYAEGLLGYLKEKDKEHRPVRIEESEEGCGLGTTENLSG